MQLSTFVGFILLFVSFLWGQTPREDIAQLEYYRKGEKKLVAYLSHKNDQICQRALRALGRIQNPVTIENIASKLLDDNIQVRIEAAFALGQMWHLKAQAPLLDALSKEKKEAVLLHIIEALGKVGNDKGAITLVSWLKNSNVKIRAEVGYALAILGYRQVSMTSFSKKITPYLQDKDPKVRAAISYALMRMKADAPLHLLEALKDSHPSVRMHAARALGRGKSSTLPLLQVLNDKDWRVVVNALNALGSRKVKTAVDKISLLLKHSNKHIQISAIRALGNIGQGEKSLHSLIKEASPLIQGEILIALAKINGEKALPEIVKRFSNGNLLLQMRLVNALGQINSPKAAKLLEKITANTKEKRILAIALESFSKTNHPKCIDRLIASLDMDDIAIITYAAQGLAKKGQKKAVTALITTYKRLNPATDVEAMDAIVYALGELKDSRAVPLLEKIVSSKNRPLAVAAVNALKKLTGKNLEKNIPINTKITGEFPHKYLQKIKVSKVQVQTNKGNFVIEPFSKEAPVTVANFFKLIQKEFYTNLTFHRVVPNFVIQGGDPRGDGWGGPGYFIPCEINTKKYTRGMVGMPLAGKDTGGCQLFITHSEQPHLNGRYTIFGRIISGMEVVDKIQEGDVIKKMSILKE